ncbi:receptor-like protein kinase precursor [Seminavis robusta]|uniref:Receptor-like protein kinase n=1 Tax=Seminavis robusta TaxID=568900 RepID=A0A9N8EQF9_9STRA|nr:receptor-like protein kinase precursor [Seminavis robusta]|eukprot:Sro1781_g297090.1 receptor-like protein kinase precursor (816) ;mRNA; f:4899-7434
MVSEKEILNLTAESQADDDEDEEEETSQRNVATPGDESNENQQQPAPSTSSAGTNNVASTTQRPSMTLNARGEAELAAFESKIHQSRAPRSGSRDEDESIPLPAEQRGRIDEELGKLYGGMLQRSSHNEKETGGHPTQSSDGTVATINTISSISGSEDTTGIQRPQRRAVSAPVATPGAFPMGTEGARQITQPGRLTTQPCMADSTCRTDDDNTPLIVEGDDDEEAAPFNHSPNNNSPQLDLLVEARLVGERSAALSFATRNSEGSRRNTPVLAQASPMDENAPLTWKEVLTSPKVMVLLSLALLLVIAASIAGIIIGVSQSETNDNSDDTQSAVVVEPFDKTLPEQTIQAMQQDPSSPQARANQWMVEDLLQNNSFDQRRQRQRFALATFYYATGGDEHWSDEGNWLNHSLSECDWGLWADWTVGFGGDTDIDDGFYTDNGVYSKQNFENVWQAQEGLQAKEQERRIHACTGSNDSTYHYLILMPNILVGTLPPELFLFLPELTTLMLGWNARLTGPIPSEVGLLSSLEYLDLDDCSFLHIPSEIGRLKSLQALNLYHNQISGVIPTELGMLDQLKYLFLDSNQMTGRIPSELGLLKDLVFLSLEANALTGSIPEVLFPEGSRLYDLRLGINSFEGSLPSAINHLTDLTYLHVGDCGLQGTIPDIGQLTLLEGLVMADNNLTGTISSEIGLLTSLEELMLEENQLVGAVRAEIGALTALVELQLGENQLTSLPSTMGLIDSLVVLDVTRNPLVGSLPSELGLLTNLESFHLSNTYQSGAIPPEVCELQEDGVLEEIEADCDSVDCCEQSSDSVD